jgi:DNA-binding XRE family transcriptional regulator
MKKLVKAQDLGFAIRHYRKTKKITQLELAQMANLSRKAIIDLEKGKPTIQFVVIEKILKVIDINLWIEVEEE